MRDSLIKVAPLDSDSLGDVAEVAFSQLLHGNHQNTAFINQYKFNRNGTG